MAQVVLVISGHRRLREGIERRLRDDPGIERVETTSGGKVALERARILRPDVIVADQEQEFLARRAMALLAGERCAVRLILLSADGSQMVTRTVSEPEPATWSKLHAAINPAASASPVTRRRRRVGGES
jgi:DNA-binding NarL/FixJ family response regulator